MKQNSVFILGAGASMPFGFPSGDELKDAIFDVFGTGTNESTNLMRKMGYEQQQMRDFAINQKRAPYTIDEFLGLNPGLQDLGKMAIALTLLPKERISNDFLFASKDKNQKINWYKSNKISKRIFFLIYNTD